MKVLYFGTVCDIQSYNKRVEQCSYKPSVAPILFETALLNGFKENGMNIDILSFPMLPTFPAGKELFFGGNTEQLSCGYSCCWLRTINLPFLKQISRRLDARRLLKKWLKENAEDGIIFTYSIPPFLVKDDDIVIGNGCWIGVRSTILGGIKLGDGCVVAACACVTKKFGDDVLVGGVPAKEIKELPYD